MPVEEQVVSIFAGTRGYLDDVPVADVRRFELELLEFMRTRHASMLDELRTAGVPDALAGAVEAFKEQFLAASSAAAGRAVDPTSTDADELGDAASQKTLVTE
jgi:F-type H+-transporting ATPase subunit alpha